MSMTHQDGSTAAPGKDAVTHGSQSRRIARAMSAAGRGYHGRYRGSVMPPPATLLLMANLGPNSAPEQQPQMQPQPLSSLTTGRRPRTLIPQEEHPGIQWHRGILWGNASPLKPSSPVDSRPHSGAGHEEACVSMHIQGSCGSGCSPPRYGCGSLWWSLHRWLL